MPMSDMKLEKLSSHLLQTETFSYPGLFDLHLYFMYPHMAYSLVDLIPCVAFFFLPQSAHAVVFPVKRLCLLVLNLFPHDVHTQSATSRPVWSLDVPVTITAPY